MQRGSVETIGGSTNGMFGQTAAAAGVGLIRESRTLKNAVIKSDLR